MGARRTQKPRVVVTGSSGLLGRRLVPVLGKDFQVVGIDRYAPADQDHIAVDITEEGPLVESIQTIGPELVVHAAAETNVDRCETDRDLAWKINTEATANIAGVCEKVGARLILISTDYVFDGEKGNYGETDQPNPVNFYGLTKLEAELIVMSTLPNSLIVRTSVLYGWHPSKLNFATWVLDGLYGRRSLRIVKDHINSPTFADDLAQAIQIAIRRNCQGILHIAGRERISRFDFARRIAAKFDLDENLLVPVEMRDLGWTAKRPRDSSLNVGKAEKELGMDLLNVDQGLEEMAMSRP